MKSPLKLTINSIIQTRYGTTKLWTFHTPPKKKKNLTSTLTSVLRLLKKEKERNLDISDNK